MARRTDERTAAERGQVDTDAAEVYEEFFVPALFGQWPDTVLDVAGVRAGDRVVDVGCGTGALARAAARRVGSDGSVIGVDPNEGMLAVARRGPEDVEWRPGVAEDLPLEDESVERSCSQFVHMFVDDGPRAVREMRRVTRPGGTVTIATWARAEDSPGYAAMIELLSDVVGADAADALRAPFVIGTEGALWAAIGDVLPTARVSRHKGVARFASVDAWLHTDIRGWTLSGMVDDVTFEQLRIEAERALAPFVSADGSVRFVAPALIATAEV